MTIWALLFGLPFIIQGFKSHGRRHNARHAPAEAAERYIAHDNERPTPEETEAIRRDRSKSRVRFVDDPEAEDLSRINPWTGEVR